ncbi:MAG: hypothetical protein COB29_14175 [Sulfitobacter sp.]|nr:MAG: hypothetical protein COB29_14175 [Sulfitobacter sp.]
MQDSGFVEIDEREFYSTVRLSNVFSDQERLEQVEQIQRAYCASPICLKYLGTTKTSSQVGTYTSSGMQTNGKAGYLMFGPYKRMNAGEYVLRVTGKVSANGENIITDVAYHKGKRIFARFTGLGSKDFDQPNILLEERVILDEAVPAIEVRIKVDKDAVIFIDGYSLRPVAQKNKDNE